MQVHAVLNAHNICAVLHAMTIAPPFLAKASFPSSRSLAVFFFWFSAPPTRIIVVLVLVTVSGFEESFQKQKLSKSICRTIYCVLCIEEKNVTLSTIMIKTIHLYLILIYINAKSPLSLHLEVYKMIVQLFMPNPMH